MYPSYTARTTAAGGDGAMRNNDWSGPIPSVHNSRVGTSCWTSNPGRHGNGASEGDKCRVSLWVDRGGKINPSIRAPHEARSLQLWRWRTLQATDSSSYQIQSTDSHCRISPPPNSFCAAKQINLLGAPSLNLAMVLFGMAQ